MTSSLALANQSDGFMTPTNLEQALKVSEFISKSQFCPKQFYNKPADVLICLQVGQELGLKPMQALQNIAVINGRPSVWGDAVLAICKNAPEFEYISETYDAAESVATCKVKRKGEPEVVVQFSQKDAKTAGLWGKSGPWSQYPFRMMQMRARGFALRDAFPDRLRGIISREEAQDYSLQPSPESKVVCEDKIRELSVLAERAGATVEDVCLAAKVESIDEVKLESYTPIKQRLIKKINSIKEKNKIKSLMEDKSEPEIVVETLEGSEVVNA